MTDRTATEPAMISEFLTQVKYGMVGSLNRTLKFLNEISVGIKEVSCRLPDELKEERTTK